jgi:hypothetical protein
VVVRRRSEPAARWITREDYGCPGRIVIHSEQLFPWPGEPDVLEHAPGTHAKCTRLIAILGWQELPPTVTQDVPLAPKIGDGVERVQQAAVRDVGCDVVPEDLVDTEFGGSGRVPACLRAAQGATAPGSVPIRICGPPACTGFGPTSDGGIW